MRILSKYTAYILIILGPVLAHASYSTAFFTQKLEHNSQGTETFLQRYHYNGEYADAIDSPVILNICGEWECLPSERSFTELAAKELSAHVFHLEHRYYGASMPFKNHSTENLKHLTFENALADIQNFQEEVVKTIGLNRKWILIGGSYAGTLAIYYQMTRPDRVLFTLASSAPVKAHYSFSEMDRHAYHTLSAQCRDAVIKVNEELEQYPTEVLNMFDQMITTQYPIIPEDIYGLAGAFSIGMIQYGQAWIDWYCNSLIQAPDSGTLIGLINAASEMTKKDPFHTGFGALKIEEAAPTMVMRQFFYQMCSSLGYFQPAHNSESILSPRISEEHYAKMCNDFFGINNTEDAVNEFNRKYYSELMRNKPQNLILTNGKIDHWRALSDIDEEYLHEGSHVEDLFVSDSPSIISVQNKVLERLKQAVQAN